MQIYNTMTRQKEEFVPVTPGEVKMYVCGPTVYNYFHIGNARPFVVFDTLRRYFEFLGYKVTFVQNFTDIDDKLINRAREENTTVKELADRYIKEYYIDADALGVERASENPRATEHIDDILKLVKELIDKGHAYVTDNGDVYFDVRSYSPYGKLSGQSIDALESGARVDMGEVKRDPLDFALWKAAKPGEPSWDTPWGVKGRPGWHIECSAMSMSILGAPFDIHAGGRDLIFPHHENEIAQSEAATGKTFANYWMHNGYINIDNEKMSKSLGNFKLVREISKEYELEAMRLFLLHAQYRNPVNFSRELMEEAESSLERIRTARTRLNDALKRDMDVAGAAAEEFKKTVDDMRARFIAAMDDDLNTADALGVLFDLVRAVNTYVSIDTQKAALEKADALFSDMCKVFGLLQKHVEEEFSAEAVALLEQRQEARGNKDYKRADEIRDKLKEMGLAVEDGKDGAKLKRI